MLIYSNFVFFTCWNPGQYYANTAVSPAGVTWEVGEQFFVFSLKDQNFKMCHERGLTDKLPWYTVILTITALTENSLTDSDNL